MVMATILQHILFIDREVICRFVTYSTIIVLFCSLVDTRLLMIEKKVLYYQLNQSTLINQLIATVLPVYKKKLVLELKCIP